MQEWLEETKTDLMASALVFAGLNWQLILFWNPRIATTKFSNRRRRLAEEMSFANLVAKARGFACPPWARTSKVYCRHWRSLEEILCISQASQAVSKQSHSLLLQAVRLTFDRAGRGGAARARAPQRSEAQGRNQTEAFVKNALAALASCVYAEACASRAELLWLLSCYPCSQEQKNSQAVKDLEDDLQRERSDHAAQHKPSNNK